MDNNCRSTLSSAFYISTRVLSICILLSHTLLLPPPLRRTPANIRKVITFVPPTSTPAMDSSPLQSPPLSPPIFDVPEVPFQMIPTPGLMIHTTSPPPAAEGSVSAMKAGSTAEVFQTPPDSVVDASSGGQEPMHEVLIARTGTGVVTPIPSSSIPASRPDGDASQMPPPDEEMTAADLLHDVEEEEAAHMAGDPEAGAGPLPWFGVADYHPPVHRLGVSSFLSYWPRPLGEDADCVERDPAFHRSIRRAEVSTSSFTSCIVHVFNTSDE